MIYLKDYQQQVTDYKDTSTSISVWFSLKLPFRSGLKILVLIFEFSV